MCVRYTLHCLQSIQSSLPQYYSVHSTTIVNEYLWACIGGPFLHSSLIFNCCTVEFLTCTQHSENHADPLVQSLTISNSKTKLEAAMWSNTRRTFYGYSTFSHAMANTQTPGYEKHFRFMMQHSYIQRPMYMTPVTLKLNPR